MTDSPTDSPANPPIESYSLSLLFHDLPTLDLDVLQARLDARCGPVETLAPAGDHQLARLVWPAPDAPSQAIIYPPGALDQDQARKALRQTWDWPAAEAVLC